MGTEKNRAKNSRKTERQTFRSREISGIHLEKWVNLGVSISHFEEKVIFVKGGIPGEKVRIRVDKENSKLIWGTVLSVEQPSSLRIQSDCSIFPECGGCSYRHITYKEELSLKKELLRESLSGLGKFAKEELPEISVLSGPPDGYRNTAQIKLGKISGKLLPGFYRENSNHFVPLPSEGCRHLPEEMNAFVRDRISSRKAFSKEDWKLRFSSGKVFEYGRQEALIGPLLPEKTEWKIPANGFTQVNRFLLEEWMLKIRSWVPSGRPFVQEFYSGSGLISLSIAPKVSGLQGFELSEEAVRFARSNAKNAGHAEFEFTALDLNSSVPLPVSGPVELMILNPPRAGASPALLSYLEKTEPSTLIYSSCNHSTLSRDLGVLRGAGYKIREIVLTDFFPRTQHFEILVLLYR